MGLFDDFGGGLGVGMLGLGAIGTGFGAYSNYSQQKRLRDLYNQQMGLQQQLTPQAITAGSDPLYQQRLQTLQKGLPQILRQGVMSDLGQRGVDPSGGYGQLLTEQATAPYLMDARNQATQDYINSVTQRMQGLQGGANMIGGNYGNTGALGNSLQSIMLLQALRNRNTDPSAAAGVADTSGLGGAPSSGVDLRGGYSGGSQLDFGAQPFTQNYFPDQSLLYQ